MIAALYVATGGIYFNRPDVDPWDEARDARRLFDKVMPEPNTGCWLWGGGFFDSGYGCFWMRGKSWRAHRAAFVLARGPIPDGACVCHGCDTPACVNPDHLFLGTNADNTRDRHTKGRSASGLRNGQHTKPESRARGNRNGSRLHPERLRRGAAVNTCKLTADQVRQIRLRHADGETVRALAREFGVHRTTVRDLVLRRTWRHV